MDPQIVDPAYIRWYAEQMKATAPHVVSSFQRNASGDIGPMLKDVQTPMLMLAAAALREEVLGDFRGAADLFPNGRKVIFPGVQGFVQHIIPVPCARVWPNSGRRFLFAPWVVAVSRLVVIHSRCPAAFHLHDAAMLQV